MISDNWYKEEPEDQVWWLDTVEDKGRFIFSFDKKKQYNLFEDYFKLPPDLKEIFDTENPFWHEFFEGR